jgi:hypothetical protein
MHVLVDDMLVDGVLVDNGLVDDMLVDDMLVDDVLVDAGCSMPCWLMTLQLGEHCAFSSGLALRMRHRHLG